MKDKVSELRQILKNKKEHEEKKQPETKPGAEMTEKTASQPYTREPAPPLQEDFKQKYTEAMKANAEQKDMYLRKMAEFENFRKRLIKEQEEQTKFANENIISEIIPILDSLEMTLSHTQEKDTDPLISGVKLILKQFLQTLERLGVKEITGEGSDFDPTVHEAIGTEKRDAAPPGKVLQIHRKGYTLKGRLIRAAMVTVSA